MPTDSAVPLVLLFGHPGSGKSSLLGALQRAGEIQGDTLGAEVLDPSGRLSRIRDHLYSDAEFEPTRTELVTYELKLRPWRVGAKPPRTVIIHDCDGNAANALLKHPEPITERSVRGTVATAVVQADLIALVVDASADDAELDDAFDEFIMFLERVHGRKAFEREVGGFPIMLVLTQCDQLVVAGEPLEEWEAEVRTRLDHALRRFAEFLREQAPIEDDASPYLPFGSVTVHGHAVAVRSPGGNEPYQVAECFREIFALANEHRDRVLRSQRGLRHVLWSVAAAVWLMFAGAIAVTVFQPQPADPGLADRVLAFREREPAAAERLSTRHLTRNKAQLTGFQSDPGFFALPDDLRDFVAGRLHEIADYQAYLTKLTAAPAPAEARSLDELSRIELRLNNELALPAQYTWGETEAARLRDKFLADVPALRAAEAAWQEWYRGLVNQALALTHARSFDGDWRDRVAEVESAGTRPPFEEAMPIPGSPSVPLPRGEAITYGVAAEFDRVYQASRDWEFTRSRLGHQRGLADALGLTSNTSQRLLDLPPPGSAVDPAERLKQLTSDTGVSLKDWSLANFPEPARAALTARLRESIGNGARQARRLIAERFTADSPAGWRKLAESLNDPAIRDWGRLLHVMLKLDDSQAADPVEELAAFLRTKQFSLDLKGFELAIPLTLRVPAVIPTGPLTVTIAPANGEQVIRRFTLAGEGSTEGLNTLYRFVAEKSGPLAFAPGDGLRVELPVRSGDQRFLLTWDDSATRTYPFDRFVREPKLAPATGAAEPATGVVLNPAFGSRIPRLPLLMPDPKR